MEKDVDSRKLVMWCGKLRRQRQSGTDVHPRTRTLSCQQDASTLFFAWVSDPIVGLWALFPLFRTRGLTLLSRLLIECELSQSRTFVLLIVDRHSPTVGLRCLVVLLLTNSPLAWYIIYRIRP